MQNGQAHSYMTFCRLVRFALKAQRRPLAIQLLSGTCCAVPQTAMGVVLKHNEDRSRDSRAFAFQRRR